MSTRNIGTWLDLPEAPTERFHAVVLANAGHPQVLSFEQGEDELRELSDLVRDGRVLSVFSGEQVDLRVESVVEYRTKTAVVVSREEQDAG